MNLVSDWSTVEACALFCFLADHLYAMTLASSVDVDLYGKSMEPFAFY